MFIDEVRLRRMIRSLILEEVEEEGLGEKLLLNYGDIVEIKESNVWISSANPCLDKMSYVGGVYSVENVYFKDGDESEDPMIFCKLKDIDFEKTIKDVPCYSSILRVVKRMEQLSGLRLKDKVILKDISEYDYRTMHK